jgi:hypothetical protein
MLSFSLQSNEHCEVEFPVSAASQSLGAKCARGDVRIHVQGSKDWQSWSSPIASARLKSGESRSLELEFAEQVRAIRVLLCNVSHEKASIDLDF